MTLQLHADNILEDGVSDDCMLPAEETTEDTVRRSSSRKRCGVVYISRIPPHLKPQKMRQLLEQHGEVARLYMAPEMASLRAKRKKLKGNTGKNFTEGWVEFEDKRVAKSVTRMLNGQPMGGKRRSAYHYDLWCLKYLQKFQWESLTEEIVYQRALHDQKLAAEISTAKRDRDFYMSRVDKAKGVAAIKERKQQQEAMSSSAATEQSSLQVDNSNSSEKVGSTQLAGPRRVRGFGQRKVKGSSSRTDDKSFPTSLLSLIAGNAPA